MAAFLEKRKPSVQEPLSDRVYLLLARPHPVDAGLLDLRGAAARAARRVGAVQRAGGHRGRHVLRRLRRPRYRSGPRSPTASMRAGFTSPAACLPPPASAGFGLVASGFCERGALPGACSASASRRRTCRACACSPTASPGPTRAATSPSIPPSSASAPRCRSPSRDSSRRATAGAPPSSSQRARAAARRRSWCSLLQPWTPAGARRRCRLARCFRSRRGAGCSQTGERRLHARLHGALPGALRLARLDGGIPRVSRPACTPAPASRGTRRRSLPWSICSRCRLRSSGNEVALRIGRRRWILVVMAASGTSGIAARASARPGTGPLVLALLVVYSMLVMAESGTLTAGLVAAAPDELRGAAHGALFARRLRRRTARAGRCSARRSTSQAARAQARRLDRRAMPPSARDASPRRSSLESNPNRTRL